MEDGKQDIVPNLGMSLTMTRSQTQHSEATKMVDTNMSSWSELKFRPQ
jgi:hypothetical protein